MTNTLKYLATMTFACFVGLCGAQQVPLTHSTALDKSVVTFPQGDSGEPLLLLIGFSHKSEKQCDSWNERLKPAYLSESRVTYYELADFQGVPSFVMGLILHGLRRKIPKDEHSHFVPLYSNEAEWKKLVGYVASEDAYLLVADAGGHVLWQAHGSPTELKFSQLQTAIAKQVSKP